LFQTEVTGADPSALQSATVDLQSSRRPIAVADGSVGVLAETWVIGPATQEAPARPSARSPR
jgi:hypothetical protein